MRLFKQVKRLLEDVSDLELASDPTTDANKLHELLNHPDKNVSKAVANNPNIVEKTWKIALKKHPEEALTNFHYAVPGGLAIVDNPNLKNDKDFKLAQAHLIPADDPDFIKKILAIANYDSLGHVAAHTEDINKIKKILTLKSKFLNQKLASNENTPAEVLHEISFNSQPHVKNEIARNKNTSEKTLRNLAINPDMNLEYRLSLHSNTPIDILQKLAENGYFEATKQQALLNLKNREK